MIAQDIQWCVTVIHNASVRARQRKRQFNRDISIGTIPDALLHRPEMTSSLNDIELVELLSSLSEIESQIMYYSFIFDLTQQEISNHLNISQQQVSRIKRRALNLLREEVFSESGLCKTRH
ncbi:sigma-70 family RNA polymerase sigma factor [Desulfosporosinus sp. BG]|uniref:sigma-70 family RNA polymerase sigma factor n=1 Tax=Desulfosporosinus sp. BG TaxID=1633135 RepID=UPI00083A93CB|nr:sigma-70 family RNA polymerase sigma factor [Desulfosporosinus sp. BG]